MLNFLSNSIKFTFSGSIQISAIEYKFNNEYILITVKDTGIGIPKNLQN